MRPGQKWTEIKDKNGVVIRRRIQTMNSDPSMTQQQYRDSQDVNHIMKKYLGQPDPSVFTNTGKGVYGDFSNLGDYQENLNKVMAAEEAFMTLNSDIRTRFGNDPGQLLKFLGDNKNFEEAVQMGLVDRPPAPGPDVQGEMLSTMKEVRDSLKSKKKTEE